MTAYTYSDERISDLHNEAFGFHPTECFLNKWEEMSPVQKQDEWDYLCQLSEDIAEHDRRRAQEAVVAFESRLRQVEDHAGTVESALRWMTQQERENGWMAISDDAEYWVWNQGFLYTERGREVVQMLKTIYNMEN